MNFIFSFLVPFTAKGMLLFSALALFGLILVASWIRRRSTSSANTIGFVHPAAFAGGGGERVLWLSIEAIMVDDIKHHVTRQYTLYCVKDDAAGSHNNADENVLKKVELQFGTKLPSPIHFVYIPKRAAYWLEGKSYPFATLLLQTIVGGLVLYYYCAVVNEAAPIIFETVGIPMVYPLFRFFSNSKVVAYVHYPIISSDMIDMVKKREGSATSTDRFLKNSVLRAAKITYYYFIMLFYRFLGQFPDLVFTNSSWTNNHVRKLFWPRSTHVLFPPCPVKKWCSESDSCEKKSSATLKKISPRRNRIVSIGQFRPEKNHSLQLKAFSCALPHLPSDTTLVLCGGCRNQDDQQRVNNLKQLAENLKITERVEFLVNVPFDVLQNELKSSLIGLHAMKNEHFGIVVVEYMAAGCIPLAHRSGGVVLDIVKCPELGFLAETENEFSEGMRDIFRKQKDCPQSLDTIRVAARKHALSFDDSTFRTQFVDHLNRFIPFSTQKCDETPPDSNFATFEKYAAKKKV